MGASLIKGLFIGVGAFTVGLLYFYALSLSIIVVLNNDMHWYVVVAAWLFLFSMLYYERSYDQKLKSGVI